MPKQPGEYGYEDTSLKAMGGEAGVRKLVDLFYDAMEELPEAQQVRAMHPADLGLSRDKLAAFLTGWLGGPKRYRERFGPIRIPPAHRHLHIGPAERDAWLLCMQRAVDQMPLAADFKVYFMGAIAVPAERSMTVREEAPPERAGAEVSTPDFGAGNVDPVERPGKTG